MTSDRKKPSAGFWVTVALVAVLVMLPGCSKNSAHEATEAREEAERIGRATKSAIDTANDPEKRREAIDRIKRAKIGK
jgi:cell division protein FtsN